MPHHLECVEQLTLHRPFPRPLGARAGVHPGGVRRPRGSAPPLSAAKPSRQAPLLLLLVLLLLLFHHRRRRLRRRRRRRPQLARPLLREQGAGHSAAQLSDAHYRRQRRQQRRPRRQRRRRRRRPLVPDWPVGRRQVDAAVDPSRAQGARRGGRRRHRRRRSPLAGCAAPTARVRVLPPARDYPRLSEIDRDGPRLPEAARGCPRLPRLHEIARGCPKTIRACPRSSEIAPRLPGMSPSQTCCPRLRPCSSTSCSTPPSG